MGYESVPASGGGGGGGGEGGVTDHGELTGLGDNDHPQYRLVTAGALTPGAASGNDRRLVLTGDGVSAADDTVANVRTYTITGGSGSPGADGKTVLSGAGAPDNGVGANGDFWLRTNATRDMYGPKTAGDWGSFVSLKGETGAQGSQGATGAAGTNGNTLLSGTAAPTTEGVNGDWYIRTTTNQIYGPKAAGAWGSGTSIVGPMGPAGADGDDGAAGAAGTNGNTVLNGTAAPTTEGVNGDFYLRNPATAPVLYGPKAAGSWPGSGISLVGPAGGGGSSAFKITKTIAGSDTDRITFSSGDGVNGNTHLRYRLRAWGPTDGTSVRTMDVYVNGNLCTDRVHAYWTATRTNSFDAGANNACFILWESTCFDLYIECAQLGTGQKRGGYVKGSTWHNSNTMATVEGAFFWDTDNNANITSIEVRGSSATTFKVGFKAILIEDVL